MTRPRLAALVLVAILTAWYLADAIRIGGTLGLAAVIAWMAVGILVVERLERRP